MNARIFCILVILLAVVLVVTPAAAGIYSTRMPSGRFSGMNAFSQGMNEISANPLLLNAVQAKDYQPRTITPFGTGSSVTTSAGDLWSARLIPPVNFGCGCGCG
ncbi:MAG: hypothetical protein WC502_08855 [Methanolinea sp.]|jgi:hypothetical protein